MLFSGLPFLCYFLPVVVVLYALLPWKNQVLLVAGILFYFLGEPKYCFLLLFSILIGYWHPLFTSASIFLLLGLLVVFKYLPLGLSLPLGISFYTFQLISYLLDVSKGRVEAEKSPLTFALFVSFFPQLIAGPIVRFSDVRSDLLLGRKRTMELSYGMQRFVIGLAKKVLLADRLGELAFRLQDYPPSVLGQWLLVLILTIQLYFDFSGYSDMAIGLGRVFGFHLPENFRYPFTATSVTDFWRRWHITLMSFLKDYVYLPLGGSHVSRSRHVFNILFVWLLSGIWHGAGLNFPLWGLYFGVFLILEKYPLRHVLNRIPAVFQRFYLLFVLATGFVLFHFTDFSQIVSLWQGMFGLSGLPVFTGELVYILRNSFVLILAGVIGATPLPAGIGQKFPKLALLFCLCLLLCTLAFLIGGSFHPFLYFRF